MLANTMPSTGPRIRYEEFLVELVLDTTGEGLRSRVLQSPGGGGSAHFEPPFAGERLETLLEGLELVVLGSAMARETERLAPPPDPECDPKEVGTALYRSLFTGQVAERFAYSRGRTAADDEPTGLRLRIQVPPEPAPGSAPGPVPLPSLASLPWELLYDPERHDFLGRGRRTPVVRCLDVAGDAPPPEVEPPVAVLVAMASPQGSPPLDLGAERRRISEAWGSHPFLEVDFLPNATLEAVRRKLFDRRFHVVHFIGHGRFNDVTGDGTLLLEDGSGGPQPVSGTLLADTLRDAPPLHLVSLNACQTARFSRRRGRDPYTGVATALVIAGQAAVIAMQFPISDAAAIEFSRCFYRALAEGDPLEAAVAEGRHGIYRAQPEGYEWATPVLFLRGRDGVTLEGVVQARPVPSSIRSHIDDASTYVDLKSRDFVGRGFLFDEAERFFHQAEAGYFLLDGDPGIGKTAFVAEMVRRHGHVHHFNRRSDGIVLPEAFLANVCAQLIARYGLDYTALPSGATRDAGFLNGLLNRVSRGLAPGRHCLILVDALDESDRDGLPPNTNPLMLPAVLPAGIFCLTTSRRSVTVDAVCPTQRCELAPNSAANRADLRKLIERRLRRPGLQEYRSSQEVEEGELADLLEERSAGNFMYLSLVLDALERGELRELGPGDLPQGLQRYYSKHWKLMQGADEEAFLTWKRPVLEALAVAPEPLSLERVMEFSRVADRRRVQRALELWRPFLHVTREPGENRRRVELYSIYHESFREFLEEKADIAGAKERYLEGLLDDE